MITSSFSQVDDKTITIEKRKLYQGGQRLDLKQAKTILAANPASSPDYEQYRKNYSVGNPLMLAGVVCVGVGAGISLASTIKESNDLNNSTYSGNYPSGLGLMGLGLALEIVGVCFVVPANKHFKQAINKYNSDITKSSDNNIIINLFVTSYGLGLRLNF